MLVITLFVLSAAVARLLIETIYWLFAHTHEFDLSREASQIISLLLTLMCASILALMPISVPFRLMAIILFLIVMQPLSLWYALAFVNIVFGLSL